MMYSAGKLDPPPGFTHFWETLHDAEGMETVARVAAFGIESALVLANLSDAAEVSAVLDFLRYLNQFRAHSGTPVVLLVPHSVAPPASCNQEVASKENDVMAQLLNAGINDIVLGMPGGFKLASTVQARLSFLIKRESKLHNSEGTGASCKGAIDNTMWMYLRHRLQTGIPEMDPDIMPGEEGQVDGFQLGEVLGQGSFGKVFKIKALDGEDAAIAVENQVIKSVEKQGIDIYGLKSLKSEIAVLQLFSSEYGCSSHPHIVQLYEVYHTWTHIFLRMQFGGPENLHQRLRMADPNKKQDYRPLSVHKATTILAQCASAVHHMHTKALVAHRDIKTDNIIVLEPPEDGVWENGLPRVSQEDLPYESECGANISVMFSDFGLAKLYKKSPDSTSSCGTFSFMAPEVLLRSSHNVFASDIWSLGIVFLEVLCFVNFVERVFRIQEKAKGESSKDRAMMEQIRAHFEKPNIVSRMLVNYMRENFDECNLLSTGNQLLTGMLQTEPGDRWKATEVGEGTASLMQGQVTYESSNSNVEMTIPCIVLDA